MNDELQKTLTTLGVKMTLKPILAVPARGFTTPARLWRVTLIRKVGRGKEAKELRFSTPFLEESPVIGETPKTHDVVACIIRDVQASTRSLWDFAQTYSNDRPNEETGNLHRGCKRVTTRIKRFFGEMWDNVIAAGTHPPIANTSPTEHKSNHPPAKKSA